MLGLLVAALFIALNGFFVAAEFALVKVRATQLAGRVRKGDPRAIAAHAITQRLDRYLSVTQFGITLASLGLGWIGEPAAAEMVERFTGPIARIVPERVMHVAVVVVAFGALTFAHVLFGELVPKLVAIQRTEKTALLVATPLRFIYFTFRPLLFLLERATRVILRAAGMKADVASEGTLSEDEILGVLAADAARSSAGQSKRELLERVLRFSQRTARHPMVPRVDVAYLPIDTTGADAIAYLRKSRYSRVLLSKERSLDAIAGYLYSKDLLLAEDAVAQPNLWGVRRDVLFVPESQNLLDVLREMQRARSPIAAVVDEYGGTSGILTMEDVLEEIVGDIRDELDEEPARVVRAAEKDAWDVDARATMEELRAIGVHVDEDDAGETVGAYVVSKLGRLPRQGDKVDLGEGSAAEIAKVARRRVTLVRVRLGAKAEPAR